jgi:5'(3')-deoxyribonucleotidase
MKILLDMDGVLTDFVTAMCSHHKRSDPYLDPANYGQFDMYGPWDMDEEAFWSVAELDFWKQLPVMPGAHELVAFLEQMFGQENICILSSPSKNLDCVHGKIWWLRKHFNAYRRSFLIGPKKEFCAGPDRVLVDDYDRNYDKFVAAGGCAVLVPRLWNRNHHLADQWLDYTQNQLLLTLGL